MNVETFSELLPEEPRDEVIDWIYENSEEIGLGERFAVFHRESITVDTYGYSDVMDFEDLENHGKGIKRKWGAICRCLKCGETYVAGYTKEKETKSQRRGMVFYGADCGGIFYSVDGLPPSFGDDDTINVFENEIFRCPYCEETVEAVHSSRLRNGRTYQTLVTTLENIDGTSALVSWLVRKRFVNERRVEPLSFIPRDALVIADGKLYRFTHTKKTGSFVTNEHILDEWRFVKTASDQMQRKYYNYNAWNHTQIGGVVCNKFEPTAGTTAEKTGLEEYINLGGGNPCFYLYTWKFYKNIENLMKAPLPIAQMIVRKIDSELTRAVDYFQQQYHACLPSINKTAAKPRDMLKLQEPDYRDVCKCKKNLCLDEVTLFAGMKNYNPKMRFSEFNEWVSYFQHSGVNRLFSQQLLDKKGYEAEKVFHYLKKQNIHDVNLLIDYREAKKENKGGELTPGELFPRELLAAHDREVKTRKVKVSEEKRRRFTEVAKTYEGLKWSSGRICVFVAQTPEDLINEGEMLHHCVGGYAENFCNETDVIFFVRHYRRPERSWFTLDIGFKRDKSGKIIEAQEKQLHGYKNEMMFGKRLNIPPEVREFVERWKKEVLEPFVKKQNQVKKKKQKKAA